MSKHDELVKALRCCIPNPPETCEGCTYNTDVGCNVARMMSDAADAIEALEKQIDSIENEKTNLEADIINLEIAIDKANTQLPKRGEWYKPYGFTQKSYKRICTNCQDVAYFCGKGNYRYCPNCGAKMGGADERRT